MQACLVEMNDFAFLGDCEHEPRSHLSVTGGKIVGSGWLAFSKRVSNELKHRSRWVIRELDVEGDDTLYAAVLTSEALSVMQRCILHMSMGV